MEAREFPKKLYLWLSILALAIAVVSALAVFFGEGYALIEEKIDARIDQKLETVNQSIIDLPSNLEFRFEAQSRTRGRNVQYAPPCPEGEGWRSVGDFKILHWGGENGYGGFVRLCMRVKPKP